MIDYLKIHSQRQRRALDALLAKDSIEVKDLGIIIGALNPRQIVFELRENGFRDTIKTKSFECLDRDGKVCSPGRYYIPPELKPMVGEFLKKDGLAAAPKSSNKLPGNNSHDKGRR